MVTHRILLLIALAPLASSFSSVAFTNNHASQGWKTTSVMHMINANYDANLDSFVDKLEKNFNKETHLQKISDVESSLGMPWKTSIDPKLEDEDLLYMPFWEWQMSFMKEHLTDLRVESCTDDKENDFSFRENTKKKARIVSMCLSSKEYRKIRMTYYDAGNNTQVFNSVWYPDPSYNLPVLGIDLLAFNRKKYLAIVDFQPLYKNEEDHSCKFEHLLKPVKEQYESLKGRMSSKFYDETQFFSQEMLFARFSDESIVSDDLFPAFKSYVETHLKLLQSTKANPSEADDVLARHKAYDVYSAERDPATGLFTAMFGGEWANDFVHNFLFSLSESGKEDAITSLTPVVGGSAATQQAGRSRQKKGEDVLSIRS